MTDPGSRITIPETEGFISRARSSARRVPFTLAMIGMLVLASWLTGTSTGVQLGARAIARLGFAPADTASFDLVRAIMSAFVTNGPTAFWIALPATAILAGITEWRNGSLKAATAFWGAHLITLGLSWALLVPLHLSGDPMGRLLFVARDVGPSAGFMGCLGYMLFGLKGKAGPLSLAFGVVVLSGVLLMSLKTVASEPAEVSAALSHLLALPVGFVLGLLMSRRPRPPARNV